MRKSAFLLIGVLALFIFLGIVLMQSLVIVQRIATVSGIVGPVYVKKAADPEFRPLAADTQVLAGTQLRTGPGGEVTLNWVDGTRLRMAPESQLRVRKCSLNTSNRATTSLFDLDVGRIWVRVLELLGERSKFEIRTPTATAGVRGTVFSVQVDETGAMTVQVYEGAVEVAGAGRSLTASEGLSATVTGSSASTRPIPEPDELAFTELAGIIGPRLELEAKGPIEVAPDATTVTIAGVAEPEAKVMVDGEPVELDRRNRFSHELQVPADAADFDVVVTAEDARGGKNVVVQRVVRAD